MSICLTDELAAIVEAKVAEGRYASPTDVIRDALRALEAAEKANKTKLDDLRHAWDAGVASGDAGELDFSALKRDARARLVASKA